MMFDDWLRQAMDSASRRAGSHPQSATRKKRECERGPSPAGLIARGLIAEGERDIDQVTAKSGLSRKSVEKLMLDARRAALQEAQA